MTRFMNAITLIVHGNLCSLQLAGMLLAERSYPMRGRRLLKTIGKMIPPTETPKDTKLKAIGRLTLTI